MGGQRAGVRGQETVSERRGKKPVAHAARPIKSRRDHKGASAAAGHLSAQAERDALAEKRLQALLHELDKFDVPEDENDESGADGYGEPGSAHRWSDDLGDLD